VSSPVPSTPRSLQSNANGFTSALRENFLVSQIVTIFTAAALLITGWLIFVFFAAGPTLGFQADQKPSPTPGPPVNPLRITDPSSPIFDSRPINTAGSSRKDAGQEKFVLLSLQRIEFESRTTNLTTIADNVGQRIEKWQRRIELLPHSDEGRRLASSAREVRFLLTQEVLTTTELVSLRDSIQTVRNQFTRIESPKSDLKTEDDKLANIEARLRFAWAQFDALETALDEFQANAKPTSNGPTLRDTFKALDAEADKSVLQEATEQEKALKARFADEIKTAKQDRDNLRNDAESAQKEWNRIETEAKQKLADAAKQRTEQLQELAQQRLAARKRMEEALPGFRDQLSPFISKGYRQLVTRKYEVVIDAQPFSFSAIIREGALENDAKGLESLFSLGGSQRLSWLNDRPIGSFPKNASELDVTKPDIIRQLKAIQEFLRQHGEAMVEAKLLSP